MQHSFYCNQKRLKKAGLTYIPLARNHSIPLYSLFCDAPQDYPIHQNLGRTTEEVIAFNQKTDKDWKAFLASIETEYTVISGEDLSRLPLINVSSLKEFVEPYFDTVKVIAYIRPPKSFMQSMAQEEVKAGEPLDDVFLCPPKPSYRDKFEPYIQAFGQKNILLKPFVRSSLVGGDIVQDILETITGDGACLPPEAINQSNETLSWPGIVYLDSLNRQMPMPAMNDRRHTDTQTLYFGFSGPRFYLCNETLQQATSEISDDIDWINAQLNKDVSEFDIGENEPTEGSPTDHLQKQRALSVDFFVEHINSLHRPHASEPQSFKNYLGDRWRSRS